MERILVWLSAADFSKSWFTHNRTSDVSVDYFSTGEMRENSKSSSQLCFGEEALMKLVFSFGFLGKQKILYLFSFKKCIAFPFHSYTGIQEQNIYQYHEQELTRIHRSSYCSCARQAEAPMADNPGKMRSIHQKWLNNNNTWQSVFSIMIHCS